MHLLVYPQFFLPKLKTEMSLDIFNRVSFFFPIRHPNHLLVCYVSESKKIRHPECCHNVIQNIVISSFRTRFGISFLKIILHQNKSPSISPIL